VLNEEGREVVAGSGEIGRVARRGRLPIGYYKDPEKSAQTFVTIDGVQWSMPGDYAEVELDGSLRLLGRGNLCINTGGEKVFPEEVEEVLKVHQAVSDAAVVGVRDERYGEMVVAIVEPQLGEVINDDEVIAHVKLFLAPFKAPRRVCFVNSIGRSPNGKLNYTRLRAIANDTPTKGHA
jgi:fatty-acyl-CoA synthase